MKNQILLYCQQCIYAVININGNVHIGRQISVNSVQTQHFNTGLLIKLFLSMFFSNIVAIINISINHLTSGVHDYSTGEHQYYTNSGECMR